MSVSSESTHWLGIGQNKLPRCSGLAAVSFCLLTLLLMQVLDADRNALVDLPESFSKLVSLTMLGIEGNKLGNLPQPLCCLRGLEVF